MANTDFFDDDLVKQRDPARKLKLNGGDQPLTTLNDMSSTALKFPNFFVSLFTEIILI